MALEDLGVLVQEHPVQLVERVAGFMRIPALRHRRQRLAAPLPGQALERSDRRRRRHRLTTRTRPRTRQPAQLLQSVLIEHRARGHWGRLGSELSDLPMS